MQSIACFICFYFNSGIEYRYTPAWQGEKATAFMLSFDKFKAGLCLSMAPIVP